MNLYTYNRMQTNITYNNIFEEELIINIDFDTFEIDKDLFIFSGNTWNYRYVLNTLPQFRNVREITNINYDNINLRFRYSNNGNTYSNFYDINETNLALIKDINLWIDFEITVVLEEEPNFDVLFPTQNINIKGLRNIDEIFDAQVLIPNDLKVVTAQDTYKVFKTTSYEVFLKSGNIDNLEIYFRYTQNQGRSYTDWLRLTDANLQRQLYIRVKFTDFQFGFRNIGNENIEIYDLELIGDFQNVTGNYTGLGRYGLKTQCNPITSDNCENNNESCCKPCSSSNTPWGNYNSCNTDSVTNMNDNSLMSAIIEKNQLLNEYAEAKNHWIFDYYYTDPDKKGIDTMLHEFQLLNVVMQREVKVMVPDNQFPVDTISYSGFGLDLILQFEVHILRSSFKKIFGVESRPRKGDYLFLCNTNLMYEVEQVLDKKDVMNASFYWRVILKKYEQKASRKFAKTPDGEEAKFSTETLIKYTDLNDLFSDNNAIDIAENNMEIYYTEKPDKNSEQAVDLVKGKYTIYKSFDETLKRTQDIIWNASIVVSDNQYQIPMKSKNKEMIVYTYHDSVDFVDNRALSLWFMSEDMNMNYNYLLFSNYDETEMLGYKLNLYNGFLTITLNTDTYALPVSLESNIWYSFYVGIDQSKEDIEMAVYKRQSENGKSLSNNNLIKIFSKNWKLNLFKFNHTKEMFIGGVDINSIQNNRNSYYLTNIVIWSEPIIRSKRSAILNQQKIKDPHLVILVDDAKEPLNLPFYGNI